MSQISLHQYLKVPSFCAIMFAMSIQIAVGVPTWDVADRMSKSLKVSGLSVGDMAVYLDVRRETISKWTNDRTEPSTQTLRLWALKTGVDYNWLTTGNPSDDGPHDGQPENVSKITDWLLANQAGRHPNRGYLTAVPDWDPEGIAA